CRVFHVALRVEIHQEGNSRHDHCHRYRQCIDMEGDDVAGSGLHEPAIREDSNSVRGERAWDECGVEEQDPGVDAGQPYNRNAQVGAELCPHREMGHLGIFIVVQSMLTRVLAMRAVLLNCMGLFMSMCSL